MTYIVFDCAKSHGYLFETRHKWLAVAFCKLADVFTPRLYDYEATYNVDSFI